MAIQSSPRRPSGRALRPRTAPWHVARTSRSAVSSRAIDQAIEDQTAAPARLKQLIQIGIALTSERDVSALLERIVAEARRFTNAEAGTLFLRDGDVLRFAVAQNDVLAGRIGEREMRRQFAPHGGLVGDFFGGIESADVAPVLGSALE